MTTDRERERRRARRELSAARETSVVASRRRSRSAARRTCWTAASCRRRTPLGCDRARGEISANSETSRPTTTTAGLGLPARRKRNQHWKLAIFIGSEQATTLTFVRGEILNFLKCGWNWIKHWLHYSACTDSIPLWLSLVFMIFNPPMSATVSWPLRRSTRFVRHPS